MASHTDSRNPEYGPTRGIQRGSEGDAVSKEPGHILRLVPSELHIRSPQLQRPTMRSQSNAYIKVTELIAR